MIASSDYKFVLLCNPKTATTAFESAYNRYADFRLGPRPKWKHINYRKYKNIFGDYFEHEGCDVYVVVRHPISTLVSWYSYRARSEIADPTHANYVNYTGGMSFERFVDEWSRPNAPSFARVTNFMDFCSTEDKKLAPLKYFRFEDIGRLNEVLSSKVGADVQLPVVNRSSSATVDYDRDAVSRVPRMARLIEAYEGIRFE
ncbi:MAG: hypothetical protein DI565_19600 [Ancylobacter novellus]|uniref:Sulfotransferase family protein n=1 Tax=Ancylobacter novellus TaxID=921 RepID=A0A2W5K6V8_ANCNO|nr:MAG: hypothetical protein DI565_19600 [Ancylobacter novellus]